MLYKSAAVLVMVGTLAACGHTPQERAASGALIGGAVGAAVGLASQDRYSRDHYDKRDYRRDRHHRRHHHRHRHRDRWDYYDDDRYYD